MCTKTNGLSSLAVFGPCQGLEASQPIYLFLGWIHAGARAALPKAARDSELDLVRALSAWSEHGYSDIVTRAMLVGGGGGAHAGRGLIDALTRTRRRVSV